VLHVTDAAVPSSAGGSTPAIR